ncbi:MAG TPA: hypothetical protein VII71_06825 [Verrucomicrobiae bacterium]
MNEKKLKQLFAAARKEIVPVPPEDFPADVLRVIRREPPAAPPETFSIFDQLNLLFPRCALVAVAFIGLGFVADFGLTAAGVPNLNDGVSQISAQWLLMPNGF